MSKKLYIQRQKGLTLIELLVAMAVSLIVVLAAVGALLISRQGFTQVDAASQLRDNGRFAEELVQRLAVQTGYRDVVYAATSRPPATSGLTEEKPNIFGFNNRARSGSNKSYEANSSERSAASVGYGSDILVLRFQSASSDFGGSATDSAIIDCAGLAPSQKMDDRYERFSSVFHVADSSGEPALMCTRWPEANDGGNADTQPIISGVENFQVLYGVDTKGKTQTNPDGTTTDLPDSVTDQYLRADELTDTSDDAKTLENWQKVRSLRIGMVLRAGPGTAVGNTNNTIYPFGPGNAIDMFASANDAGTIFTPANDGRLRQIVTFTVHLRNPQRDE